MSLLPDGRNFGQITQNRPHKFSLAGKLEGRKSQNFAKKRQQNRQKGNILQLFKTKTVELFSSFIANKYRVLVSSYEVECMKVAVIVFVTKYLFLSDPFFKILAGDH
jgi:hypothetical protein